jgi:hypothetical protein
MKKAAALNTIVVAALFALIGCGSQSNANSSITACEDPRPEICTADYVPVCGAHADGTQRTYSNACSACSVVEVQGYSDGACE